MLVLALALQRGGSMGAQENEIMTVQEVARYLRLNEATIYKMANAGDIPAVKVGRAWRFRRQQIDDWFNQRAGERK